MVYDFSFSVLLNFLLNLSWDKNSGRTNKRCRLCGFMALYFCRSVLKQAPRCFGPPESYQHCQGKHSHLTCLPQWFRRKNCCNSAFFQNVIKHTYSLVLRSVCPIIASVTFAIIISRVIFSQNKPQKPRYQYR